MTSADTTHPTPRVDPWLAVALAGIAASWLVLCSHLVWPDLVRTDPFMAGDSQDWIANGLRWAGFDVRYSVRPPLFPMLIAALVRLHALPLLPLVTATLLHVTAVAALLYLRRFGSETAALVTLAVLWNHALLRYSLDVMADVPAACLLALAALCLARADGSPRLLAAAGALAGLSAVTQQTALLAPLAAGPVVLASRRAWLRSPWLWLGAAAFAAPPAAWFAGKLVAYGTIGGVGVQQWGLVRPHLGGAG